MGAAQDAATGRGSAAPPTTFRLKSDGYARRGVWCRAEPCGCRREQQPGMADADSGAGGAAEGDYRKRSGDYAAEGAFGNAGEMLGENSGVEEIGDAIGADYRRSQPLDISWAWTEEICATCRVMAGRSWELRTQMFSAPTKSCTDEAGEEADG